MRAESSSTSARCANALTAAICTSMDPPPSIWGFARLMIRATIPVRPRVSLSAGPPKTHAISSTLAATSMDSSDPATVRWLRTWLTPNSIALSMICATTSDGASVPRSTRAWRASRQVSMWISKKWDAVETKNWTGSVIMLLFSSSHRPMPPRTRQTSCTVSSTFSKSLKPNVSTPAKSMGVCVAVCPIRTIDGMKSPSARC
mmetsp:Transcript_32046/g.73493  ORF Transcript_32046/g.73493 Transcript_32046/m.73493 type:complete len:202 (+) Transcript_32046:695-1300(+)